MKFHYETNYHFIRIKMHLREPSIYAYKLVARRGYYLFYCFDQNFKVDFRISLLKSQFSLETTCLPEPQALRLKLKAYV